MNYFTRKIPFLIFMVIFSTSCAPIQSRYGRGTEGPRSEQVVNKALKWIISHPATFEDGGFLEMGEESNVFYILYTKAEDAAKKNFYRNRVARIIDELRARKDFHVRTSGEVVAYLTITKVAERLGFDTADFREFIRREILENPLTYPPNITFIIFSSSLLCDLGYEPKISLETIIGQGVIATVARNSFLIPLGKNYISDRELSDFFYYLTHEIFAVSSFGDKNPEQMLLPKEIEFLQLFLQKGISVYLPKEELDILCELVICAKMMNHTGFPGFDETVQFIVSAQKEDGSFGFISRMKDLGRGNLYRHGVLVATWALAT